jgi:hypothetical protein
MTHHILGVDQLFCSKNILGCDALCRQPTRIVLVLQAILLLLILSVKSKQLYQRIGIWVNMLGVA